MVGICYIFVMYAYGYLKSAATNVRKRNGIQCWVYTNIDILIRSHHKQHTHTHI